MTAAEMKVVRKLYKGLDDLLNLVIFTVGQPWHPKLRKAVADGADALSGADRTVWLTEPATRRNGKMEAKNAGRSARGQQNGRQATGNRVGHRTGRPTR